MYVLRMRLCNDMVYSYVDCLSERALENSSNWSHWHAPTPTGSDVTFLWRNKIPYVVKAARVVKNGVWARRKKGSALFRCRAAR